MVVYERVLRIKGSFIESGCLKRPVTRDILRNGGYIDGTRKFSSRLGFILISAGCAIGLGNVWRFPYIVGEYGGAAFVLVYLVFLLILGLPIVVMEFAVGRASRKSAALSFDLLEPKGSRWHLTKYIAMAGNYILMMFYTTVGGWMMLYFLRPLRGISAAWIQRQWPVNSAVCWLIPR